MEPLVATTPESAAEQQRVRIVLLSIDGLSGRVIGKLLLKHNRMTINRVAKQQHTSRYTCAKGG